MVSKRKLYALFIAALTVSQINAAPDPNFHCYLLFGQSNMAGGGAGVPLGGTGSGTLIAADCDTSTRVKVLAFCDCNAGAINACSKYKQSRVTDNWYTAYPALHICGEGVSPGDWFAKTMLDSIRDDIKIGLIPCALSGQGLNVFVKGGSNFNIPNWAHPTLGNNSPYAWMLAKCMLAQKTGVIKGILLHQGESGAGGKPWGDVAKAIIDSLKKDLGLPSNLPVVVGELRQDASACCAGMNKDIDAFSKSYPSCGLASSLNLGVQTDDPYHFNPEGMRELGKRYAKALLSLSSNEYIPRKGTDKIVNLRFTNYVDLKSQTTGISVYSLNGKVVRSFSANDAVNAVRVMKTGGVYIVNYRFKNGRSVTLPFVKE
jgi:hypothetical protein